MTTLFLVRHATTAATGRTLGGRTPAPLDDAGRSQAMGAGQRLAFVPLKAVYSSPLARAMQTASAIAASHNLPVVEADGLLEVDYGAWTDKNLAPLTNHKLWPTIQLRPSLVRFPQGESIRQMQLRAIDALEVIAANHPRHAVAAVTHGDVIKAVVAFYVGMPLDMFQRLTVSPASCTVLSMGGGGQATLLRFNDDGPLTPDRFAVPKKAAQKSATKGTAKTSRTTTRTPRPAVRPTPPRTTPETRAARRG